MRRSGEANAVASSQPCAGKFTSRHGTACARSCGLDALVAWRMGVMSWLDATPKPPGSTAAHRRALRATTPFETPFFAYFFWCPFRPAKKWENAFKAGGRATLPALGRRLSRDGVRGTPPTKTGAWARLFARWGGKFFAAPPGLQKPRGRGCLPVRRGA